MKKYFITALILLVTIWFGFRYYKFLDSIKLFDNQVVFQIYLDIDESEVDSFFKVTPGTFNKEKHAIYCRLPVDVTAAKPNSQEVRFGVNNIDCNQEYNNRKHIKYDGSELINQYPALVIAEKNMFAEQNLEAVLVRKIATKLIDFKYARGKINNIIISKDSIYQFCK